MKKHWKTILAIAMLVGFAAWGLIRGEPKCQRVPGDKAGLTFVPDVCR